MVCEEPTKPADASPADYCGSAFAFGFNDAVRETVSSGQVWNRLMPDPQNLSTSTSGLLLGNHDSYAGKQLIEAFNGDDARYRLAAATCSPYPASHFYYRRRDWYGHQPGQSG